MVTTELEHPCTYSATRYYAAKRGLDACDLAAAGIHISSAGVYAASGAPATQEAVQAINAMGFDLSKHRSRPLSTEAINEADVIYCMTESHRQSTLSVEPSAANKTKLLDEAGDIPDPIGGDLAEYQRCADTIRRALEQRLAEPLP